MNKKELREKVRQWQREEIEAIELIEAAVEFVEPPRPIARRRALSDAAEGGQ